VLGSAPVFRMIGESWSRKHKLLFMPQDYKNSLAKNKLLDQEDVETQKQKTRNIDFCYSIAEIVRFRVNVF